MHLLTYLILNLASSRNLRYLRHLRVLALLALLALLLILALLAQVAQVAQVEFDLQQRLFTRPLHFSRTKRTLLRRALPRGCSSDYRCLLPWKRCCPVQAAERST